MCDVLHNDSCSYKIRRKTLWFMEIWGFILLGFMSRYARFTRGLLISASNSAHPLFTTLTSDACAHQSNTSLPLFRTFSTLAFQKYFYLGLMSSHLTVICECELHLNELYARMTTHSEMHHLSYSVQWFSLCDANRYQLISHRVYVWTRSQKGTPWFEWRLVSV